MRRTIVLALEVEGIWPDPLALRDRLVGTVGGAGSRKWSIIEAEVVDDGYDTGREQ